MAPAIAVKRLRIASALSGPRSFPSTLRSNASWLNQVEIYFSIVQRKALTPNDFTSRGELEGRLLRFQDRYQQIAPFQWMFKRCDLTALMEKVEAKQFAIAACTIRHRDYEQE